MVSPTAAPELAPERRRDQARVDGAPGAARPLGADHLLDLQASVGNRTVTRLVNRLHDPSVDFGRRGIRPFVNPEDLGQTLSGISDSDIPSLDQVRSAAESGNLAAPPPGVEGLRQLGGAALEEATAGDPENTNRPDNGPAPASDPANTNRPDGASTPTPDPENTNRPDGASTPTPDPENTNRPDGASTPTPDPENTNRPDGASTPTPDPENTNRPSSTTPSGIDNAEPTPPPVPTPDPANTNRPDGAAAPTPDPANTDRPGSGQSGGGQAGRTDHGTHPSGGHGGGHTGGSHHGGHPAAAGSARGPGGTPAPVATVAAGAGPAVTGTEPAGPPAPEPAAAPSIDHALVDAELAEHAAWGAAQDTVGGAGSAERAQFIADHAGSGMLAGLGTGAAGGAVMAIVARGVTRSLAHRIPVPIIGSIVGGVIGAAGLAHTLFNDEARQQMVDKVSAIGTGSGYEFAANTLDGVATILDLAANILDTIALVTGVIAGVAWLGVIPSFGATSPFAVTCTSIAAACSTAATVLSLAKMGIAPVVLTLRALHTFTSDADPRAVQAQGAAIEDSAKGVGGILGGLVASSATNAALNRSRFKEVDATFGPDGQPVPTPREPAEPTTVSSVPDTDGTRYVDPDSPEYRALMSEPPRSDVPDPDGTRYLDPDSPEYRELVPEVPRWKQAVGRGIERIDERLAPHAPGLAGIPEEAEAFGTKPVGGIEFGTWDNAFDGAQAGDLGWTYGSAGVTSARQAVGNLPPDAPASPEATIQQRVSPAYEPPPTTPEALAHLQAEIATLRTAEAEAGADRAQGEHDRAETSRRSDQLRQAQQGVQGIDAQANRHDAQVQGVSSANTAQAERQQSATEKLTATATDMTGTATIRGLLRGWQTGALALSTIFRTIGTVVAPANRGADQCYSSAADAQRFLEALDQSQRTLDAQRAGMPAAAAGIQQDRTAITGASASNARARQHLATASQGVQAAQTTNAADASAAAQFAATATTDEQHARSTADERQATHDRLVGELDAWAQQHRAARQAAIAGTVEQVQAQGRRVVAVSGSGV